MNENEPLNQSDTANVQIVKIQPTDQSQDQAALIASNDHKTNSHLHTTNGTGHKSHSTNATTQGQQLPPDSANAEPHIEAPCCRDIHGKEPPDGGMRAWLVMLSAFLCNGVIFGIINCYGVIHSLLTDRLAEQGDKEASSKAALVGSLTIGTTFLLSPVAGCLVDKIGLRLTTFIGGVLSAGGLLLSSFFTANISALYLTYGVMFGLGAALAYTPTLAILGHYFKRYLGKVSGFVTAGSSVFTVILPPALDSLVKNHGLEVTLQGMSLISCFIIVCSFVYKPLHPPPGPPKKKPGRSRLSMMLRSIINVEIWKQKRYVIWALCVPSALFGYFVPYVHMVKFVQTVFPGQSTNLPVMCIGVTSGLGRLIFGVIADLPGVNRILLQQISLICIGAVTLLLPLTSSYILLIVFTLIMGLFDGCFISLLGPIAYQICGPSGATQAIGFLLGLSSLPLTVGPPIAGKIFDTTGSYTTPFVLAGIPPIVGASVMFLIRCVRDDSSQGNGTIAAVNNAQKQDVESNQTTPEKGTWTETDAKPSVPLMNGHNSNSHLQIGESEGGARLAVTGTESYTFPDQAASISSKPLVYSGCKCRCSSRSLLVSAETALLSSSSMSSLMNAQKDEEFVGVASRVMHVVSEVIPTSQDSVKRRRYKYSVY